MFYFLLVWWGLKSMKLIEIHSFLPTSIKFVIQNNPLMQLHWTFQKAVNKINWKPKNFKFLGWAVFHQLRNWFLEWKRRGGMFNLFLSLVLSVHINLLFSNDLLIFFSSPISLFFFFNFVIYLLNMNKWVLSLVVPPLVFNFNSRNRKQTLIVFNL